MNSKGLAAQGAAIGDTEPAFDPCQHAKAIAIANLLECCSSSTGSSFGHVAGGERKRTWLKNDFNWPPLYSHIVTTPPLCLQLL